METYRVSAPDSWLPPGSTLCDAWLVCSEDLMSLNSALSALDSAGEHVDDVSPSRLWSNNAVNVGALQENLSSTPSRVLWT